MNELHRALAALQERYEKEYVELAKAEAEGKLSDWISRGEQVVKKAVFAARIELLADLRAELPVPTEDPVPKTRRVDPFIDIQRAVADYYGTSIVEMLEGGRHRASLHPRMVAMYLCRQRLGTSFLEIGERFGGRDHTTVISAVRRVEMMLEHDKNLRTALDQIVESLR